MLFLRKSREVLEFFVKNIYAKMFALKKYPKKFLGNIENIEVNMLIKLALKYFSSATIGCYGKATYWYPVFGS